MDDKPFPWEALYRALVRRICELNTQYPVSTSRLHPEIAALAEVHSEITTREKNTTKQTPPPNRSTEETTVSSEKHPTHP